MFGHQIHPHPFFEILGYVVGFLAFLLLRLLRKEPLTNSLRLPILATAVAGSAIGAKVLFLFENPRLTLQHIHDPAFILGGKTIVGALLGGLFAVELMKKYAGIHRSTGDMFAIPLLVGIAVGRIGCFLTGLTDNTYGTPTSLPWGIDFGDGITRHPTQLYEIIFIIVVLPILLRIQQRIAGCKGFDEGDVFKFFMVAYLSFRLLCDFVKPYPRVALGLGTIQWACLLALFYYSVDIWRWVSVGAVLPTNQYFK